MYGCQHIEGREIAGRVKVEVLPPVRKSGNRIISGVRLCTTECVGPLGLQFWSKFTGQISSKGGARRKMLSFTLRLPVGVILIACSALAFSPSIPLSANKLPASRATASRGSVPCMGAVESSAEERRSRRAIVFGAGLLPALAVTLGGGNAALAQRPPPRPKVTSIPDECKQVCVPDTHSFSSLAFTQKEDCNLRRNVESSRRNP